MLIALAVLNVAIALLCLVLAGRVLRLHRQLRQLNHDLTQWAIAVERTLVDQTLTFTQRRAQLRQWQLTHLRWQLQQRQLVQVAKLLRLVWLMRRGAFWPRRR
ncbi:MAG: hypothetical protein AAFY17_09030 [Cyanobacteria bacterium J06642_11]